MKKDLNNASDILFVNGDIEQKNDDSDYSSLDQNQDLKDISPISQNTLLLEKRNSSFNKSVLMSASKKGTNTMS